MAHAVVVAVVDMEVVLVVATAVAAMVAVRVDAPGAAATVVAEADALADQAVAAPVVLAAHLAVE